MPTIPYTNSKGGRLSGVTTIIGSNLGWNKQQLMYWAWKEGTEGRDYKDTSGKAANAGTIAHYLIECNIKGIEADTSQFEKDLLDKAETAYLNFLQWKENVSFDVIATEPHLVSEVYQYGLTPDCIARINGKPALFDWKSGSGIYEDHAIQLSAYKAGWEENYPDMPLTGGFHLLRIDKETASFTHKYWHDLSEAWEAFLKLLEIHNLHKKLKTIIK